MDAVVSVSDLTWHLKATLEDTFPSVLVRGEISNWRRASSGHVYFVLKDADAVLPAVMWRSAAGRLRLRPEDGMEVVARGRIDVYPPHGKYQLIVEALREEGEGAAARALEELKRRLREEGLFDPLRKRPLPLLPRRVGLVTSPTGQAVRDMLRNILRRHPRASVVLRPVRVQGDGAGAEVAAGLRDLAALTGADAVDVCIVGRGGGSKEDLDAFNDEALARAIAAFPAPVVSAVGHEGDWTVADLVADVRVSTPTAAAEAVVPELDGLLRELGDLERGLRDGLRTRLDRARERVRALATTHALRRPVDRVRDLAQRVDEWTERLHGAAAGLVERRRERLAAAAGRVEGVSPLAVLARGYSVTRRDAGGPALRDAADTAPGERLRTRLARGVVVSEVVAIEQPDASTNEED